MKKADRSEEKKDRPRDLAERKYGFESISKLDTCSFKRLAVSGSSAFRLEVPSTQQTTNVIG